MRLLILDRDGVINEESDAFIKSAKEWHPISGSLEAIARANRAGYRVVVISNQSGLARGMFSIDALNCIHHEMHKRLAAVGGAIDAVFFCPHGPDDGCDCRKPRPGLLHAVARRLRTSLHGIPLVGDRHSDILAAQRVGASPVLVQTGRGLQTMEQHADQLRGVACFPDLAAMVDDLLR